MEPIKYCWFCKHFNYSPGWEGTGDTYGHASFDVGSLVCGKDHWNLWDKDRPFWQEDKEPTQEQFGAAMLRAQTCKDFIPIQTLKNKFNGTS